MSRKEHPAWEEELMAYVDGELDATQASAVADHLKECQDCSAAVGESRRLSKQIASWKVEESPEGMGERVLAELQQGDGQARKLRVSWTKRRIWAYGLGSAVAASLLLVIIASPLTTREEPLGWLGPSDNLEDLFDLERDQAKLEPGQEALMKKEAPQGQPQQGQDKALQPPKQIPSEVNGPMVIRSAHLTVLTKEFDSARSRIEQIVRQSQGYLDNLTVLGEAGSVRTLSAALRLPSDRLDAGLVELRKLGRVRQESQSSSDVTSQYVDLQARLTNARNTEQRLLSLQRERTDKLVDVVSVEREISRVREEIERMVAQQKDMSNRVQFATINLEVSEEYRAELQPNAPTAGAQLRNASIDGYQAAIQSVLSVALFLLRYGPALLLWLAFLVPVVVVFHRRAARIS
jgi:hypothetical protein